MTISVERFYIGLVSEMKNCVYFGQIKMKLTLINWHKNTKPAIHDPFQRLQMSLPSTRWAGKALELHEI